MLIEAAAEALTAVLMSWMRIAVAIAISVAAALVVGIPAGLDRRIESVIVPILDVLQSVPILGFFPLAVYLFFTLSPTLGSEVAAIFLVFTSTFWNIAFGVYESVKSLPSVVLEIGRMSGLGVLQRLRLILIPAALPRIVSNLAASIANGFYFLAASEIISFGERGVAVHGIGSLVSRYISAGNVEGAGMGIAMLAASIALVFLGVINPLSSWSERYKFEAAAGPPYQGRQAPTIFISPLRRAFSAVRTAMPSLHISIQVPSSYVYIGHMVSHAKRVLLIAVISVAVGVSLPFLTEIARGLPGITALMSREIGAMGISALPAAAGFSLARVAAALLLSAAWSIPVAYLLSMHERARLLALPLIQIVASLPAPLFFPLIASLFISHPLTTELASILLIVLGTQWYVFYSTLGGFLKIPTEYIEMAETHELGLAKRLRLLYIPFASPSIVTGLITATGGAWNTLIVAERLVVGGMVFETGLPGLGRMLSVFTESGAIFSVAITVSLMTVIVLLLNRLLWKRLYDYTIERTRE